MWGGFNKLMSEDWSKLKYEYNGCRIGFLNPYIIAFKEIWYFSIKQDEPRSMVRFHHTQFKNHILLTFNVYKLWYVVRRVDEIYEWVRRDNWYTFIYWFWFRCDVGFVIDLINVWCCGNPICRNIENINESSNIYFVGIVSLSQVVHTKRGRLKNVSWYF
jgi:hypothetical protein